MPAIYRGGDHDRPSTKGEEGPLEPGEEYRAKAWALHALGRTEKAIPGDGR